MCKLFLDCIFSFRVHCTKIFFFYCRMKINLQDEVNFSAFCTVQKRGDPFKISLMNAFRFIEKDQRKSNFLVQSCTLNEKNILSNYCEIYTSVCPLVFSQYQVSQYLLVSIGNILPFNDSRFNYVDY